MTEPPAYADLLAQFEGLAAGVPPLPREIAVSDQGTLGALLAGMPAPETAAPWTSPLGNLLSVPIRLDDTLPPGQLHVREPDGRVSAIWQLTGSGQWLSLPVVGWPS